MGTDDHHSQQVMEEYYAIRNMLKLARENGLEEEVVFSFGHNMVGNGGLVKRSVHEALYEWDIA